MSTHTHTHISECKQYRVYMHMVITAVLYCISVRGICFSHLHDFRCFRALHESRCDVGSQSRNDLTIFALIEDLSSIFCCASQPTQSVRHSIDFCITPGHDRNKSVKFWFDWRSLSDAKITQTNYSILYIAATLHTRPIDNSPGHTMCATWSPFSHWEYDLHIHFDLDLGLQTRHSWRGANKR